MFSVFALLLKYKNLENLEIFSILKNFKAIVLFEVFGNFKVSQFFILPHKTGVIKIECVIRLSFKKKQEKDFHENLNKKSVVDNKVFWKSIKSFLSEKASGKDEIHFIENNKLVETDLITARVLNNFFSNIIQNRDISRYSK